MKRRRKDARVLYLELVEILVLLLERILVEAKVDAVLRVQQLVPRRGLAHLQVVEDLRFLEGELLARPRRGLEAQRAAGAVR